MTVKTLAYIHQLLIENEKKHYNAKEIARKAYNEAEDENAENIDALEDLYRKTYDSWSNAKSALDEFEAREW